MWRKRTFYNQCEKQKEEKIEEYTPHLHCQRCNRRGHDHWSCKEKTDIWGTNIELIEYYERLKRQCSIL